MSCTRVRQPLAQIVDEGQRILTIAPANQPGRYKLRLGIDGRTGPRVALAVGTFFAFAYVWTSDGLAEGAVIDSPHHPGSVRSIVVRSGRGRLGQWVSERRNIVDDFRKSCGREPPDTVENIVLFTDNDQTREPVKAYYGAVMARSD